MSLNVRLLSVSRDEAAEGSVETTVVLLWQEKATPHPPAPDPLSLFFFLLNFVPVKGSAGGHAPGKAFHALLSEEGDGGQIGGHDGQRVWRVHEEAVFSEDHVPVLKDIYI